MKDSTVNKVIIFVFFLSGFSGLIYESIWSHYFKLFLGHAAYAQTLVLAIFMGGMAIGSWIVSKKTDLMSQPIRVYAVTELLIGIFAIVFHAVFIATTDFSYDVILPMVEDPLWVNLYKWAIASTLILPQSVLLGATFPLLASGLVRRASQEKGKTIAMLYFSNSLGAVLGVLTSGFLWIDTFGLPGTVINAGYINIWLAIFVFMVDYKWPSYAITERKRSGREYSQGAGIAASRKYIRIFLACSAFTGMASFFYELGWIRMLSMVLGSSSHAFELMLSGFILGIAIGGFWIRKKLDRSINEIAWLAWIQLIMGLTAVASLVLYNYTFELMAFLMSGLSKNDAGYLMYNLSSHLIVLLIMLPTTICAGMTLPLITHSMIKKGGGEKSIGAVYSANTLGAIVSIFVVMHLVMPLLGLKSVIIGGAVIDILVSVYLFHIMRGERPSISRSLPYATAASAIIFAVFFLELDPNKMVSSVFRIGRVPDQFVSVQHFDGKTSSIDVYRVDSWRVISTNGKPDASISEDASDEPSPDEITMKLAAAIPLAMHQQPSKVANIGIGSGLTSHTLLCDERIERLDNIEIEQKMVEGAKLFGKYVERTFKDKRSNIIIEDAKTHFISHKEKYDLIISEPSNIWVSGISTLFSKEFYHRLPDHLKEDGLFVQWLHLYETEMPLVATVLKALGETFNHYSVFFTNSTDIMVVASVDQPLPPLNGAIFENTAMKQELSRVGINSISDILFRKISTKSVLAPFFEQFDIVSNSDYYPVLENNAVKARYLQTDASELIGIIDSIFPLGESLGGEGSQSVPREITVDTHFFSTKRAKLAREIVDYKDKKIKKIRSTEFPDEIRSAYLLMPNAVCNKDLDASIVLSSIDRVMISTFPYLEKEAMEKILDRIAEQPCVINNEDARSLVTLYRSVARDNFEVVDKISGRMLEKITISDQLTEQAMFFISANMLSKYMLGNISEARETWEKYSKYDLSADARRMAITPLLIFAHANMEI